MKIRIISFTLWALALTLLFTACDTGSGDGGTTPGPKFTGLGLNENKILVIFDKTLSGTLNFTKIKLKKGETTLKASDYTPKIEDGNLVIILNVAPSIGEKYTVELQAGAVEDTFGNKNEAPDSSAETTLTVGDVPALQSSPIFKAGSNTVLELAFNTPIEIADKTKIEVETKASTTGAQFKPVSASSKINTSDSTKLEISLESAAQDGYTYRIKVGAGGVRSVSSKSVNDGELISGEIIHFVTPALNTAILPYILGNTIIATFNRQIAIKDWNNVRVRKNPAGANIKVKLSENDVIVDSTDKTQLEITLPTVANGEVYRLILESGVVNEDGNKNNENNSISSLDIPDITVGNSPVLSTTSALLVFNSKTELSVNFEVDVALLDSTKIKVERSDGEQIFTEVTPQSIAVDNTDAKKLNFTFSQEFASYSLWRVSFPAESLISLGRVANNVELLTGQFDAYKWKKKTPNWAGRYSHTSVVFDNKIWVLGGLIRSSIYSIRVNEVWSSADGTTWTQSQPKDKDGTDVAKDTSGADANWWTKRYGHSSVVFDNKIWMIGGHTSNDVNEVWSSADGTTWTQSKLKDKDGADVAKDTDGNDANWWAGRNGHSSVVFDNKIWVLGGSARNNLNDVWSSTNGTTWTQSQPPGSAAKDTDGADANWWTTRFNHTSVMFDGKIWVLGGNTDENQSWYSEDGGTWTKAPNINRDFETHSSVIYEGGIWNLGGGYHLKPSNAISSNTNPTTENWSARKKASWSARQYTSGVVFKDKIWITGGLHGTSSKFYKEVWVLDLNNATE